MKLHLLLAAALAFFAHFASAEALNIIYINADDLGVMDVGFMGNKVYRTPNLDLLATEGMVFTNAYAPSANCAPSRAACLSGQASPRTGVYTVGSSERGDAKTRRLVPVANKDFLPEGVKTIADELKASGYLTCQMGKWHVGEDPTQQGIDINVAGSSAGHPKTYFSPYKMKYLEDGEKGEYLTDRLTDEAIQFLSEHGKAEKPFFLYMPYYAVHTPLQGKPELTKAYEGIEGVKPDYAAMIETLDGNIGRLLGHVKELGLEERTLVVFSSDNGGIRGVSRQDPWRAGKGSYYEGGVRVPLIVRMPGIEAGSRCEVPVSGLDLFPTFLHVAAGKPVERDLMDGNDLHPLLLGKDDFPERALYWHFPIYLQKYGKEDDSRDPLYRTRPGSAMRVGKWKLHEYFEDGAFELYDLEADPGERNNLAASHPEKLAELRKMLSGWREEIGAPVPDEPNPKFDANAEKKALSKMGAP
ncbi:MAG: sulfatase [Luteolibacter sp.]